MWVGAAATIPVPYHRHATHQQHVQRTALLPMCAGVPGLRRRRADRPWAHTAIATTHRHRRHDDAALPPLGSLNYRYPTPASSTACARRCFPSPGDTTAIMRLHSCARVYCTGKLTALHTSASAAAGVGAVAGGCPRPGVGGPLGSCPLARAPPPPIPRGGGRLRRGGGGPAGGRSKPAGGGASHAPPGGGPAPPAAAPAAMTARLCTRYRALHSAPPPAPTSSSSCLPVPPGVRRSWYAM